jgi:hypothetical protein
LIRKIFPSFHRFAFICIIVGVAGCSLSLSEYFSFRSTFSPIMKNATSTKLDIFFPIKEILIASSFYWLASIVGGVGLALRKNWGRIVLLILSWILMIYGIGFGIFFQIYMSKFSQSFNGVLIFFRIASIAIHILILYAIFSLIKYISRNKVERRNSELGL